MRKTAGLLALAILGSCSGSPHHTTNDLFACASINNVYAGQPTTPQQGATLIANAQRADNPTIRADADTLTQAADHHDQPAVDQAIADMATTCHNIGLGP